MSELRWKTAEGDEIPLEQMTDSHLKNAHAYLGRRLQANFANDPIYDISDLEPYAPCTDADGVASFADAVAELQIQADRDRRWRALFEAEAARRGLTLLV